jgi:hypothetical protein
MAAASAKDSVLRRLSGMTISPSLSFGAATADDSFLSSMEDDLFSAVSATEPISLLVPSLSVNPTQARFNFNDGKMSLLFRDVTRQLWAALLALIEDGNAAGIYINGPQGIGKSHAMYGCACLLGRLRSRIRVTYIQSCERWVKSHGKDPFRFLLNELCSTFQNDKISGDADKTTMAMWADWVVAGKPDERDSRFKELMVVLDAFVAKEKLCWITLVDQENALHSDNHQIEGKHAAGFYPFNIIRSFSSKVRMCIHARSLLLVALCHCSLLGLPRFAGDRQRVGKQRGVPQTADRRVDILRLHRARRERWLHFVHGRGVRARYSVGLQE